MSQRILMIRLSAIGDVINVLPAVSLLRRARPEAYIAFAVEDRAAAVIEGHPQIDEVIVFPRRRWRKMLTRPLRWPALTREVAAYRGRLRAGGFHIVLDFQGNLKGAVHAIATGATRRIGFARGFDRECNHCVSTEQVVPPAGRPHRVDKFASLLGPLGIDSPAREYVLPASPSAGRVIDAFLVGAGLASSGSPVAGFVVLHPGTSESGAAKRWPAERFAELARRVADGPGRRVVVTWGPGEEPLARQVCELAAGRATLGPSTASLLELAELLRRAAAFVSADTGPMHLAAACGTPCVALFGPKDPEVYRPWGEGHAVVRPGVAGEARPMEAIGVEEVFVALVGRLACGSKPAAGAGLGLTRRAGPEPAAPGGRGLESR